MKTSEIQIDDFLIFIESSYDIKKLKKGVKEDSYSWKLEDYETRAAKSLPKETVEKLEEYYNKIGRWDPNDRYDMKSFIISYKTGEIVASQKSTMKEEELEGEYGDFNVLKTQEEDIILPKEIHSSFPTFNDEQTIVYFNDLNMDYFNDNKNYSVHNVKDEFLFNYIDIFDEVCFDRKYGTLLWGKIPNNTSIYQINLDNILNIKNERSIVLKKLEDFL
jgi:hypothetical protein